MKKALALTRLLVPSRQLAAPPPKELEASSAQSTSTQKKRASLAKAAGKTPATPALLELEVFANPVSWQLPMDAITKTQTILEPEDRLSMLRRHVAKINNIRSGNECEILFDDKTYY